MKSIACYVSRLDGFTGRLPFLNVVRQFVEKALDFGGAGRFKHSPFSAYIHAHYIIARKPGWL